MHRRRFIGVVGGGMATIGLAGCLGLGGGDNGGLTVETDSPGAVLESWYRLLYADSSESEGRLADVWHDESPVLDTEGGQGGQLTGEFEVVDTSVVTEGLTESELQERLEVWVDGETVSRLANEQETAIVEATTRVTLETGQSEEGTERYLAVTENGEWQLMIGPLSGPGS